MKKKIVYLILLALPILMAMTPDGILSFGAPVSSSGAPGEVTCANSGCHDDAQVNNGKALLDIKVGNNVTEYIPGQTYPVTIKITEPGVNRFGFQLVALKDNDELNAGNLAVSDANRTQVITNSITLKDRLYATYTYDGTEPSAPGTGEWTMNWTAPEKTAGPVTLYVAAVSANNDNSDKGDHVYTTSLKISPDKLASVHRPNELMQASVFMNNTLNEINVKLTMAAPEQVSCALYDLQGKLISLLFEEKTATVEKRMPVNLPDGMYLVKLRAGEKEKTAKIVVQ